MPRPQDSKVWNEDLVEALRAREDQCRQLGKQRQFTWRDGATAIEAVRRDIYAFKNGRIVGLPNNLSKTVENICRNIIAGTEPKYPSGYVPTTQETVKGNPFENNPYLKTIKIRGGPYAILMAFHHSQRSTMTQDQICTAARPFCDEEMEPSWHTGRTRGAWTGHKTLLKHGLISVTKAGVAYNARAGGLRSLGKHQYNLTRDGEKFIEALLKRTGQAAASRKNHSVEEPQEDHSPFQHVFPDLIPMSSAPGAPYLRAPKSALSMDDGAALRDWAKTAQGGEERIFQVGKDRRQYLHDLCDTLNVELRLKGVRLDHTSSGTGRLRKLHVKVRSISQAMGFMDIESSYTPTLISVGNEKTSPSRKLTQVFSGEGFQLDPYSSPAKRSRLPACVAAANAALARHASSNATRTTAKNKPPPISKSLNRQMETDPITIIDSDDESPPIRCITQKATSPPYTKMINLDLSDCEVLDGKPAAREATKPSESDIVDLTVSQGTEVIIEELQELREAKQLTIFIDNRERNGNCTPRALRIQLESMLQSDLLANVWPECCARAVVQELPLPSGDFAFETRHKGAKQRLPVAVERKRVADLVQRSFRKDHWYQLARMRDESATGGTFFLLVEGDYRVACKFTAFGAQEAENLSVRNHVVDDEESLIRLVGRAILSSTRFRLLQTKDEKCSLRAVGALGLMSLMQFQRNNYVFDSIQLNASANRQQLIDRLQGRGLPWQLARCVADEVGSIQHLDLIFESCVDETCRDVVLIPVIHDTCEEIDLRDSCAAWSKAIHILHYSSLPSPNAARERFTELCPLVPHPARLLCNIHAGCSVDEAVDLAFAVEDDLQQPNRELYIKFPEQCLGYFPFIENTFYVPQMVNEKTEVPFVTFQTVAGTLCSETLVTFLVEGKDIVSKMQDAHRDKNQNSVDVTSGAAEELRARCDNAASTYGARVVLLVTGLWAAIDSAAKKDGYIQELRVLVDILIAELSISHNVVVLHATRLSDDQEMILRQLALASFHFQLLTLRTTKE